MCLLAYCCTAVGARGRVQGSISEACRPSAAAAHPCPLTSRLPLHAALNSCTCWARSTSQAARWAREWRAVNQLRLFTGAGPRRPLHCSRCAALSCPRSPAHLPTMARWLPIAPHLYPYPPPQAWSRVFDQVCFSLGLFQLVMLGILGERRRRLPGPT